MLRGTSPHETLTIRSGHRIPIMVRSGHVLKQAYFVRTLPPPLFELPPSLLLRRTRWRDKMAQLCPFREEKDPPHTFLRNEPTVLRQGF